MLQCVGAEASEPSGHRDRVENPSRNTLAVLGAAYVGVCQTRGASLRAGLIPAPAPTSTASHPRQHAPALKREAGRRVFLELWETSQVAWLYKSTIGCGGGRVTRFE
jgi:hypothetical protein